MDSPACPYTYDLFLKHGINEAWPTLNEECPSCYEPFGAGPRSYGRVHKDAERPVTPKACPGYHIFHLQCLMDWLSFGNQTCPCCRHPLMGPASLNVEGVCWECEYQLPPAFGGHKLKQEDYDSMLADEEISEDEKKEMREWDRIWTARPATSSEACTAAGRVPTAYDYWNNEIRDQFWTVYLAPPSLQPRGSNRAEASPPFYSPGSGALECPVPATGDPMEAEWFRIFMPVYERFKPDTSIGVGGCDEVWDENAPMNIPGDLYCVAVDVASDRQGIVPNINAETLSEFYSRTNEYLFNEWMWRLRSYEGGYMGLQLSC